MRVVRRSRAQDIDACIEIIRGLPDFFTGEEQEQVARDLISQEVWVIAEDAFVTGFVVVVRRFEFTAELVWMAVAGDNVARGPETQILNFVLEALAKDGVSLVEVKTLDQSADYEPYDTTRAFWQARGFHHIDTIDPMPGWPQGNPAALYIAALRPTIQIGRFGESSLSCEDPACVAQHARKGLEAPALHSATPFL